MEIRLETDAAIAEAYTTTGASWGAGPALVYDRLATVLVERSPVALPGGSVVDIGAGTGAASRAAIAAGASTVVAVDIAAGMLALNAGHRPPSVVAKATRLPFAAGCFDIAVAAFSFNHLSDPAAGFVEAARVVKPGGAVIASAYASDDQHPAKGAVEQALRTAGWEPSAWHEELNRNRAPLLATPTACAEVVARAGLDATVENVQVAFPDLPPDKLVEWRLGMAQHAPFVVTLTDLQRERVVTDALDSMGTSPPPLVRSIMIVTVRC